MSKEAYYFSHDSNARNDDKILKLRMKEGWRGYGLYWAIIERLREATNYMSLKDYNLIAFELREDSSRIKTIVEEFGLFDFTDDGEFFYSDSLLRRMQVKDDLKKRLSVKGIAGNLIKNGHLTKEQVAKMSDEEIIEFNEDIKATATRPPPDRKATANKRKEKKGKEKKENIINQECEITKLEISELSSNSELRKRWYKWLKYRKDEFSNVFKTSSSEKIAFEKFLKLCDSDLNKADAVIERSIANRYQGLFELKNYNNGNSKNTEKQQLSSLAEYRKRKQQAVESTKSK